MLDAIVYVTSILRHKTTVSTKSIDRHTNLTGELISNALTDIISDEVDTVIFTSYTLLVTFYEMSTLLEEGVSYGTIESTLAPSDTLLEDVNNT